MRFAVAVAVVLVACASRSRPPPEPSFVVTSRPEAQDPPVPPRPESRCVAPAMRARIEDCSAAPSPSREAVYLAIEESYRALAVRPPEAQRPDVATTDRKAASQEERRALAPLPLIPEQEMAITLLTSWVCRHPFDLAATYRLARLHFEHRRFEEAIVYFARVGDGPPDADLSVEAFFRWLETVNILGAYFSVTSCFLEMEEKVAPTFKRLCNADLVERFPGRAGPCAQLGVVEYDILRSGFQARIEHE